MTEPLTPLSDEDLSAALDGDAGPDVEARIQADPSARMRLDALRAASEAIGQAPAAPEPGTFDALIARAIEIGAAPAADDDLTATPVTSPDGVVTPLAPRRRGSAGAQRWLVAAVIIALVAIGLGLVYSGTRDRGDETAATSSQADLDRSSSGGSAERSPESDEMTDSADVGAGAAPSHFDDTSEPDPYDQQPADLTQLGTFPDRASLRASLRDGFPANAGAVTGDRPTNISVDRCIGLVQTVLEGEFRSEDPDAVGYASIDGQPYLVFEFTVADASPGMSKLITAAEPQSCDLLFTFVR